MCGIAGLIGGRSRNLEASIQGMTATLVHRGPDDAGQWIDGEHGLALGQRRLSIVDLSAAGHQPMQSACGRFVIVLNGEIYNHRALRTALDAERPVPWRGQSDTEVLLEAVARWGAHKAVQACVGMFAFGLWDRHMRSLVLGRDRFGEKPLYHGEIDGSFVFASELKAITAVAQRPLRLDRDALAAMMQFGYVPSPRSIHEGIRKLPPASLLTVRVEAGGQWTASEPVRYWRVDDATDDQRGEWVFSDDASLTDTLDAALRNAVADQMVADVPLGAFLSGGVDSSLVVALMQAQSERPVRTYTIGFHEPEFDEAPFAAAVARHLGTEHTEWLITPREAALVIPKLPDIYDEPFADASQVPTALVARLTRQHVTVALSGDGGDELFGGYPRYQQSQRLWHRLHLLPPLARRGLARAARMLAPTTWDRCLQLTMPTRWRESLTGHRIHRLAELAEATDFDDLYIRLLSQWPSDSGLVLGVSSSPPHFALASAQDDLTPLDRMRMWDMEHYLPDDILVKVDRAAMHNSLETRAPLLDHRVARIAWCLPAHALVRHGRGKHLLREVLQRYVPRQLIDRPKAGFGMPVARWLRADLRDWAEDLLDESRLRTQGILSAPLVRRLWEQHVAGTHDHQSRLWSVLMFQAWLGKQAVPASGHSQVRA